MATREDVVRERVRESIVMSATPILAAPAEHLRVSWGAVVAGFLLALGASLVLGALGMALGVSVADFGPGDAGLGPRALATAAAAWGMLTLLVSLYLGGMIAARSGAALDRGTAAVHGALVWVLSILFAAYLAAGGLERGVDALLGSSDGGVRQAVSGVDVMADLNGSDVERVARRLDDPATADTLARLSGTPRPEVQRIVEDARARIATNRQDPVRAVTEAHATLAPLMARTQTQLGQAAADAQPYAAAMTWTNLGLMLLSLGAAITGAMAGSRRAVRETVDPSLS